MSNITDTMSADHHRCDDIFSEAEALISKGDWEQGGPKYKEFQEAMEKHFAMEEEVLFPTFEQRTGQTMGPTQVMRMEHSQMRQLFAEMAESVEQRDQEKYLGQSETLLMVMQQHNAKEEQILYHMADQVLSGEVSEVLERMEAV
ncbi:MAG TPA: hemerythrin domain-containing protein [Sedimenticola sp.]|nr:hemerythrin domain-containing protein [Sedimenticola sp.]